MIISVENQTLKVGEFQLLSQFSSEIADFFQPLNSVERFAMLSSLIEIGWVASKVGKSHLASDYYEKITTIWTTRLSHEFQELGTNLFEELKEEIISEMDSLKNAVLVQKTLSHKISEFEDKTTIKGASFEVEVHRILSHLASYRSGVVDYVGTVPGLDGSKKGDFVYRDEIVKNLIAIEAKDLSSKISLSKIEDLLSETMKNRGARCGIFVVKNALCLPECFGEFYVGSNYIACTLANLDIAVKVAALFARQDGPLNLENQKLVSFLKSLEKEVTSIDEIIKSATASKKSALRAEALAKDLRDSLDQKMTRFLEIQE